MNTFNLQKEVVVIERNALMQAINKAQPFAITIEGAIVPLPLSTGQLCIFQGALSPREHSVLMPSTPKTLAELFGSNYRVLEDDGRILIKANLAWQNIIEWNLPHADYDDTTGDGIGDFSDSYLEEIGWHATEFDVTYREMAEFLEAHCEGTLLCVEIDEPYQFSGMGFISDRHCAHQKLFDFCRERARAKMQEDPDFSVEMLTDDEQEAASFFELL